jgi:hypothetical protein
MCSTRKQMNNKTRRHTYVKCCKAMAVPILTYGYEIWTRTQEAKIKNSEM